MALCSHFDASAFNNEVLLRVEGAVAIVTLNRPEKMNTFSNELMNGLGKALAYVEDDDAVRCVVLTGNGRAFSAGGSLEKPHNALFSDKSAGPPPVQDAIRSLRSNMRATAQRLREMDKVTFAAINGACAGAGFSLACACDVRYCSEKAVFATAFVNAGLSGDFGGTWTLPRIVGPAKARELYLLSEKFRAPEAARIGLVSKVLPHDSMLDSVVATAAQAASGPPLALRRIKANLNDADRMSWSEALDGEADRHGRLSFSADHVEAAKAFMEKRQGNFKGAGRTREPWELSRL